MKYSAALLLALLGLTAASVLPYQGRDSNHVNHHTNNNNNHQAQNYDRYNNNNNNNNHNERADQQFLEKQHVVLQLLSNAEQKIPSRYVSPWARNFNPYQSVNRFQNQRAIQHFLKNYQANNFLPQNEAFSPTVQEHINQAAQLFNFFYSAQDWNTFRQAAVWAKQRFNAQLFNYAFTAAVLNHPETRNIVIPASYEVIPHSFVPATALQQIYNSRLQGQRYATVYANYTNQNVNNKHFKYNYFQDNNNNYNDRDNNYYGPHNAHAVYAENDGSQDNHAGVQENPENRVSYFTEDVGVNTFVGYFHAKYPSFFGTNNNNNYYDRVYHNDNDQNQNGNNNYNRYYNRRAVKRGENFYFVYQQLYARYVLERLSNSLPVPQPINFQDKIEIGYNPNLQYANGQALPARPPNTYFQQQQNNNNNNNNNAQQPNNNQAENPHVYEQRLQEVAESGYVINEDGSKTHLNQFNGVGVLANLAAAPADSPNPAYYGDYFSTAKNAIGNIVDPNNQNGVAPGAAANYHTSARDPAFYQFLAKLNQIFRNFQNKQGPYSQNQLSFPGVKIQGFDVSRLVTYFESFYANVDNAVNIQNVDDDDNKYNPTNNNDYSPNNNNNYNPNNDNYNPNKNYPNDDNNDYPKNNNNNNYYQNNNNVNNNNNDYLNNNNDNYQNNNYNNNNNDDNNNNNNYKPNNKNNNYDNNNKYNTYNNNNNDYPNSNDNYNYNNNNNVYPNNNNYNPSHENNNNGNYNVIFQRLANKPFNYRLNVQSERSGNGMVRIFIGPKYDSNGQQFTLPQASQYFVQLDQFTVQLHQGQNVIERNSQQSAFYVRDPTPYQRLRNQIQHAVNRQQPFYLSQGESSQFGFPQRFQLPKGKESGQEFIFYAIITESNSNNNVESAYNNNDYNNSNNYDHQSNENNNYNKNKNYNYNNNYNNNNNNFVQDNKSVGFPFDRPVQDISYNTPNQYFKTVTIYHQTHQNNN